MTLNALRKSLKEFGRGIVTTLFCLLVMVGAWQSSFLSNSAVMAGPAGDVISSNDLHNSISTKTSEVEKGSKNLIQDTKRNVERMANENASRVNDANEKGGFFARRAKRDRDRIMQRAETDAARTEKAVDASKRAVNRTVEDIKDAL